MGGLEMPEGQLGVAGADITRVRRSRTVVRKHHAKVRAIIQSYNHSRNPAVRAARQLKDRTLYQQDSKFRARRPDRARDPHCRALR
jgi:hypothetical protein